MTYSMKSNTCEICQKQIGGIGGINHFKCSKKLQLIYKNKKRSKAPKKLTVKKTNRLVDLILKKTA